MTTSLRMSTCRRFFLVHFVCVLMFGNSAALETGPQSTSLSASHHGYQKPKVNSELRYPTRGWATSRSSRPIPSRATSGESYSQVPGSTFKDADYGDITVLVASTADGTADHGAIQDAVDLVPEDDTRRTTIFITSGIYEEDRAPTTKPCITLQGEGRNRTVITWHDTAAESASAVVESDHSVTREISFKTSVRNEMNMQAATFRISGGMAFLYRCDFFGYQDTLYDHEGRLHFFRCLTEGAEDFIFGVAWSPFERCWLHPIAHGERGALVAQGKYYPASIMGPSGFSFLCGTVTGTGRPYLGRDWGQFQLLPTPTSKWMRRSSPKVGMIGVLAEGYRCAGRGAHRIYWIRELTDEQAKPFLGLQFFDDPSLPSFERFT